MYSKFAESKRWSIEILSSHETEIGGFGISSPDDLLLVEEFITVKQEASIVSVLFDDAAVADFYDQQVKATIDSLTSLIEPVMIVLVGGLIGVVVVSMFLPIFTLPEAVLRGGANF